MHRGGAIPLVDQDAAMSDALLEISSKGFGVTGVTEYLLWAYLAGFPPRNPVQHENLAISTRKIRSRP